MTDTQTADYPLDWVREEVLAGMDLVHRGDYFGGGYKCDHCEHFVPVESLDDDVCPMCNRGGMIGTVIMGSQEVTFLYPKDYFRKEAEQ